MFHVYVFLSVYFISTYHDQYLLGIYHSLDFRMIILHINLFYFPGGLIFHLYSLYLLKVLMPFGHFTFIQFGTTQRLLAK